ncbi:MAG: hypothetical protein IJ484_07895, partial [Oscillospiraceae bacterium]|nr:hypothetical protein [Oscillospiraceae bacterium]
MSEYICKCGKRITKSTDASVTGYRGGFDCAGCPYRMPYGNYEWDESRREMVTNVKGFECRASKTLAYGSRLTGNLSGRTTLTVYSLDFDFFEEICRWIRETYPDQELFSVFDRRKVRGTDYADCGLLRMSVSCTQNKKGEAAKMELAKRFFDPETRRRLDMTPEEEKAKILRNIAAGRESITGSDEAPEILAECSEPEPEEATALTPVPSDADTAVVADAQISFDYSGLTEKTVATLHVAERMIRDARKDYILQVADAVGMAHDELVHNVDKHNNQYSEDTFRAWCASVGLSKTTAYKLLQVSDLFEESTPSEQKMLEQASPSLLYAAARPSAPAELVQAVKDGDITTHKQYKELESRLKAEQARADSL